MKKIVLALGIVSTYSFASSEFLEKTTGEYTKVSRNEFVEIRCDSDSEKNTYYEWYGEMYSQIPGEHQKLLFDIVGMNVARCFKNGDTVFQTTREIQMYLEPYTGKIVDKWENPWTGETLPVMHVANSPVQVPFRKEFSVYSKPTSKDRNTILVSVPLTYPNPLFGDDRFKEYDPNELYHATELFQYHYKKDDLKDVGISWTRVSRFLPWMKMGGKEGNLIFHAIGKRVDSFENLHPVIIKTIEERVPNYKYAPNCPLENRNETSWTYFKKHFDSYLEEDVFPIDLDLKNDICKK